MADEALQVELERLGAENEILKNRATKGVTLKVSEKGGVSVYGLGRFPVTLYEAWSLLALSTANSAPDTSQGYFTPARS